MAGDIDIDLAKMSLWTEDEARVFFESGGTEEPCAAPPALVPGGHTRGGPAAARLHGRTSSIASIRRVCVLGLHACTRSRADRLASFKPALKCICFSADYSV